MKGGFARAGRYWYRMFACLMDQRLSAIAFQRSVLLSATGSQLNKKTAAGSWYRV